MHQGLITEAEIDTSVTRLFLARFRLGMFDPPDRVRWAQIPYSVLDQPAHRALARQVARESIVLLKNQGSLLPLRKNVGTLAVIGPDADQWQMLLGNYNGMPADPVTPLRGIREAASSRTRVLYARGSDLAAGMSGVDSVPPPGAPSRPGASPAGRASPTGRPSTASPARANAAPARAGQLSSVPRPDSQASSQATADSLLAEAVHAAEQSDAVILFLGLTSRLEGEEMRVQIDGFRGGDRTSLDLPAPQENLLERIAAVGKPTVLVLLNGSALAVNWAQEHVPAIVDAWYPGQAAGNAIADVLFGDYNPGGRLPVTFYRSVDDLPPFDDYDMAGRTYRFFDGPPLYPFGHGLSYTTFAYDSLTTSADTLTATDTLTVRVNVTNTGARSGDEVVQFYVQHLGSAVVRSRQDLRGYQRVHLAPDETRTVELALAAKALAYWDSTAHDWRVESEPVRLEIGSSSADIRLDKIIHVRAP